MWERLASQHLGKNPGDFEGAFRCLPKNLQKLFVNSYQSYLWNLLAKSARGRKNMRLPVIGHSTRIDGYPKLEKAIQKLIKKEGIKPGDFKGILGMDFPGDERNLLVYPKKIKWKAGRDGLNKGRGMLVISFALPRGSYGTYVIKSLF